MVQPANRRLATEAYVGSAMDEAKDRSQHTGTQSADTITDGTANKVFTAAEKTKLAGLASGTENSPDPFLLDRANHTGTQSADTITDGTTNKVYTAAEKTKLAGVAAGATANQTDATLKSRANHTGTQSADTITDGSTNKAFTAAEKTKLAGVESRANHTGTQAASTISDFAAASKVVIADTVTSNAASGILAEYDEVTGKVTISLDSLFKIAATQMAASSVMFKVQNGDGTWGNRPTSRTDIVVIWIRITSTGADPSEAVSPAVTGAYPNDIVVVSA